MPGEKKREHEQMKNILETETAKRDFLLSELSQLKNELWYLKNTVFEHANCDDQKIDIQLAKMTQSVLEANSGQLTCPSPTSSASAWSDGSGLGASDAPGVPVMMPTQDVGYRGYPDSVFDSFIDLPSL
ncbi:transcriptional regulator family: bZIP [Penicillium canariense]|uniref:Transcriptional regulator family: bZIP n=1 Tax=Penicillium canariense TaxID=189055 RepID=A0A9W9ICQ0_9EURO|nr:transcriptional regulator family: bZIP [Penicillium canariense]KAJ5175238.1 transcriptional regulator family: bZIP [Penicillium canariense]